MFSSKKEFALAMMEGRKFKLAGWTYFYDEDTTLPFRTTNQHIESALQGGWNNYAQVEEILPDQYGVTYYSTTACQQVYPTALKATNLRDATNEAYKDMPIKSCGFVVSKIKPSVQAPIFKPGEKVLAKIQECDMWLAYEYLFWYEGMHLCKNNATGDIREYKFCKGID